MVINQLDLTTQGSPRRAGDQARPEPLAGRRFDRRSAMLDPLHPEPAPGDAVDQLPKEIDRAARRRQRAILYSVCAQLVQRQRQRHDCVAADHQG